MVSINKEFLIKGIVYALILCVGSFIGVIMRNAGSNGYAIFAVVGIINTIAIIGVFRLIRNELFQTEEEDQPESKKTGKDEESSKKSNLTESDKV
ncbi:hypothetical protein NEF87_002842 [Candidatus Lokiarchaeum ossiferum]|uniref:Uncharacterized protein n=1 Tax=Candidatus Lokiarchaeum ossiferum TaxID=2951803 RepID=A0ABY6HUM2_9ARCH|nr:hypothetical protein NEF87_002842 [Candidatus Lokiarchaeum sp. B-35]